MTKIFIMRRNILLGLLLFCVAACNSSAQINGILTKEQLVDDLHELKKILESEHPQLYRFTSEDQFDSLYAVAEKSFFYSMKTEDAFSHFSRIVACIGCGHTRINLPDSYWGNHPDGYLPMELIISEDKVLLKSKLIDNDDISIGAEITEINQIAVSNIVEQFRLHANGDGLWNSMRDYNANKVFAYRLAAIFNYPDEYKLCFKNPKSEQIEKHTIGSVSSNKLPNPFDRKPDFELATNLPDQTSHLTIRGFGFYDDVDGFKKYIDSLFSEIHEAKSKNLILDLRGNTGGDPHCSTHLMSYIISKPIPYFGKKYFGYQAYADPIPVFENRFKGKIYVLIDGGCFSTTGHMTSLLKYHKFATFIGQETGGTYTCNDSSRGYRLKNTGFNGMVARRTFYTAVEGMSWAEGVQPDYEICPNAEDLIKGNDPILDYAIKLILDHQDQ